MERFVEVLTSQKEPKQQSHGDATRFVDLFDDADINAQPNGTGKVDVGAIHLALQFENLRTTKGAHYSSLDEWLVGLGKFVPEPTQLFDAKEKQESCIKERAALYEERKRVRVQKPTNFRTYVNGLGRVYSCALDTQPITPSNKSVFPEYNKFMAACIGRARVNDAIDEADAEEVEVLRDDEPPKLHAAVDWNDASEVQRYNIVILGYRTGLRADTLEKFLVDCFNLKVMDNGEMLTPVVANVKNLAASLTRIDNALFKQQIVQCIDEHFCAM